MIHVCFGLHDGDGRFSKFTGTTLASIFANTSAQVTAHILHDATLTADSREKFMRLADRHNQRVNFYNVDELCPDEVKFLHDKLADKINSRFTAGAFYRLLAKKIFDFDKIIYLDSDTVVNLDIAELWSVDLGDYPLAAVPEVVAIGERLSTNKFLFKVGLVDIEDYFNSGAVLFNLARVDESFFADGVNFLAKNPACESVDQDIYNAFFADNYLKLDGKFNAFVSTERFCKRPVARKIYHYASHSLGLDTSDAFNALWLENFLRSGWCDATTFGHLYEEFSNYDAQIKTQLIKLSAGLNGRKRAFVTFAAYVDAIKDIFDAADNELIVIETFLDFHELIRALKKVKSKRVFFSMVENFTIMRHIFSDMGLVEGKDFFNGLKFLAAEHGYRINSYSFVKAL